LAVKNSLLHTFVQTNCAQLFGNVLMKKMLQVVVGGVFCVFCVLCSYVKKLIRFQLKWEKYARRLFLKELFIYALFLFLFVTWSILINVSEVNETLAELSRRDTGIAAIILACILPLFALRALFRESQQLWLGSFSKATSSNNKVSFALVVSFNFCLPPFVVRPLFM
jgi:hypothetical protein